MHGTRIPSYVYLLLRVCPSPPASLTAEGVIKNGYHIPIGYILSIKDQGVWSLPMQHVELGRSPVEAAIQLYRHEMGLPLLTQWVRQESEWQDSHNKHYLFSTDTRTGALAFAQRRWKQEILDWGESSPRKFFDLAALYQLVRSNKFDRVELQKLYDLGLLLAFGKEAPGERKRKSVGQLLAA